MRELRSVGIEPKDVAQIQLHWMISRALEDMQFIRDKQPFAEVTHSEICSTAIEVNRRWVHIVGTREDLERMKVSTMEDPDHKYQTVGCIEVGDMRYILPNSFTPYTFVRGRDVERLSTSYGEIQFFNQDLDPIRGYQCPSEEPDIVGMFIGIVGKTTKRSGIGGFAITNEVTGIQ